MHGIESSQDLRKEKLFEGLFRSLETEFETPESILPLHEWAKRVVLDGKPFTFDRHEYLLEPYQDDHPHVVEMKAAQLGLTTKAMLRSLYLCKYGDFRGVLYLFPSRTDVLDFSKSRVTPLIEENPDTIGQWLQDTDSAGLKQVGNAFLYLRGMQSRVGLKSIPVDYVIFDELDEAPQAAVDMAMERMGHSEYKKVLKLSNPTLPDYGIDKAFQETDQRYWLLRCEKCGEYTCLEDTFPECLVELGGRVIRLCMNCRDQELNPSLGQWVAKNPAITDKRGYHYSQLFSHFVDPKEILHKFQTTDNLADFWNLKIGIPYVEAEDRLTEAQVLACCNRDGMYMRHPGPCASGVDVKGAYLNVVIGFRPYQGTLQLCHFARVKSFQDLHDLNKAFNVKSCVINLEPDTHAARRFQAEESYEVFLCHYNEHQRHSAAYDSKSGLVQINRTEIMDATHKLVTTYGRLIIPRQSPEILVFAKECCATAKRLEEDEQSGSRYYVYVKLTGNDDYRHSLNYFLLAVDRVGIYEAPADKHRKRDAWDDAWDDDDEHESKSWMAM